MGQMQLKSPTDVCVLASLFYSLPFVLPCHVALSSLCVSSSYLGDKPAEKQKKPADSLRLLFYPALSQHLFYLFFNLMETFLISTPMHLPFFGPIFGWFLRTLMGSWQQVIGPNVR